MDAGVIVRGIVRFNPTAAAEGVNTRAGRCADAVATTIVVEQETVAAGSNAVELVCIGGAVGCGAAIREVDAVLLISRGCAVDEGCVRAGVNAVKLVTRCGAVATRATRELDAFSRIARGNAVSDHPAGVYSYPAVCRRAICHGAVAAR